MKQQTAVEWLVKEFNLESYIASVNFAMEKEKEQIIEAFNEGTFSEMEKINAEEYYTEKYNKIKTIKPAF